MKTVNVRELRETIPKLKETLAYVDTSVLARRSRGVTFAAPIRTTSTTGSTNPRIASS